MGGAVDDKSLPAGFLDGGVKPVLVVEGVGQEAVVGVHAVDADVAFFHGREVVEADAFEGAGWEGQLLGESRS